MKHILFSILFLLSSLQGFALTLLEEFQKAETGDFAVFEQQKQITLFRIAEKTDKDLVIEEVAATTTTLDPKTINWQEWLSKGAPGHTSWILSRFSLKDSKLQSIFSYSANEWIETDAAFVFLPTLFNLPLMQVAQDEKKRIGPPPEAGEPDRRRLWSPKVVFNGQAYTPPCQVLRAVWPKDATELSGKVIYLYIPESQTVEHPHYLDYFPYWVEIAGSISKVKLRVIDSGKGLTSPAR